MLALMGATATIATVSSPRKLKVLCLHGYAQNGAVLRDRSGGFRKPLKKSQFELHYFDGPFGCTANGEPETEADADPMRRAWWRGHSGQTTYEGWIDSREALTALWERERFDGVLGFSCAQCSNASLFYSLVCAHGNDRLLFAGRVPRRQQC